MDSEALFQRGKEAADRGNYDYAISIFRDLLRADPNHRNGRIALRGCEMTKFQEAGGGAKAKLMGMLKGIGPRLALMLGGKPEKVAENAERYLMHEPTNISVLLKLAAAHTQQANLDAAADTLEFARQRAPQHIGVLRRLGNILHQLGQYDKAVRCFQEINTLKPQDREAGDRVREISAESHLKRSRMDQSQSYRETLRDAKTTSALERDQKASHTDEEREEEVARLKAAVEAKPEDPETHQRLGDGLFRSERYQEAEAAYRKAFEIGKRYPAREKMGNARLKGLEKVERLAKEKVDEQGDAISRGAYKEAQKRRLEFAIKEFEFRRRQHPTDMKLAYQLGLYYVEANGEEDIPKAIQQFQQAMSSPGLKVRAQFMLGRCFAMNPKTLDMAREQLVGALESSDEKGTDIAKALMYELGTVSEKMGQKPEALNWYKKIFSVDAGFKDVTKKIQELG